MNNLSQMPYGMIGSIRFSEQVLSFLEFSITTKSNRIELELYFCTILMVSLLFLFSYLFFCWFSKIFVQQFMDYSPFALFILVIRLL